MNEQQCVLVCVTAQKDCARLIHQGSALAEEMKLPLRVLHVSTGKTITGSADSAAILNELFSLAHEVEAEISMIHDPDPASAIARFSGEWDAAALVLGSDRSGTASRVRAAVHPNVRLLVLEDVA